MVHKHIRPTGAQFSFHADICYKTNFEFAPIQLIVAQIKNEFAKTLKSETAGAQSLLYGVAQKLIRATTLNALGQPTNRFREWTPAEDKFVGTAPDVDIARQLGRTESAVKSRRAILERKQASRKTKPSPRSSLPALRTSPSLIHTIYPGLTRFENVTSSGGEVYS